MNYLVKYPSTVYMYSLYNYTRYYITPEIQISAKKIFYTHLTKFNNMYNIQKNYKKVFRSMTIKKGVYETNN